MEALRLLFVAASFASVVCQPSVPQPTEQASAVLTEQPAITHQPSTKQWSVKPPSAQPQPARSTSPKPSTTRAPPTRDTERPRPLLIIRSNLEDELSNHTGLSTLSKLQRVAKLNTTRGTVLVLLKQMIGGYELYDGGMTAHIDNQETVVYDFRISGGLYVGHMNGVKLLPTITSAMALSITARAFQVSEVDMKRFSWQRSARLMLYPSSHGTTAPTLCYVVEFYVHKPNNDPSSPHAIINATDGSILDLWNALPSLGVPTNMSGVGGNNGLVWGQQHYSDIPATRWDNGTCSYDSSIVRVQNLKGATISSSFVDAIWPCSQANNATYDSVNGGFAPLNDLARHSKAVVNMFMAYLGIGPTPSLPLLVRAHYGSGYENAFWDGTQVNVGDGKNNLFPLAAIDVVGHEFAHGFTGMCSGLQFNGQAGGVNEAFSDMAGEAAEYFLYGSCDYIIGRQITKSGSGIRYMCNPTQDGVSIDNIASFTPTMDPHYSSGVFNKAFCILSKTPQWDVPTAFMIFSYANYVCWQQLTNFTQAACCVQQAANAYGLSTSDVAKAFSSVGISVACA